MPDIEMSTDTPVIDPEWEKKREQEQQRYHRHAALVLAVKAEGTSMPLTENAEDLTDKILARAKAFYDYLSEDV